MQELWHPVNPFTTTLWVRYFCHSSNECGCFTTLKFNLWRGLLEILWYLFQNQFAFFHHQTVNYFCTIKVSYLTVILLRGKYCFQILQYPKWKITLSIRSRSNWQLTTQLSFLRSRRVWRPPICSAPPNEIRRQVWDEVVANIAPRAVEVYFEG